MSSKSKNGKKSVKSELSKDLTSFKAVTSTLKSLDENSNVVSVTKCLTRLLHYLRRIEQDDFERRDALTQAIALIGESWLRESTDNNIKEMMYKIFSLSATLHINLLSATFFIILTDRYGMCDSSILSIIRSRLSTIL